MYVYEDQIVDKSTCRWLLIPFENEVIDLNDELFNTVVNLGNKVISVCFSVGNRQGKMDSVNNIFFCQLSSHQYFGKVGTSYRWGLEYVDCSSAEE